MAFLTKREISCIRQVFQAFVLDINGIAKANKVRFFLGVALCEYFDEVEKEVINIFRL